MAERAERMLGHLVNKYLQAHQKTVAFSPSKPVRIAVTGAAGQIAYSLLPMLARGDALGPSQPIILQLLDIKPMMQVLEGVKMELEDCSFGLLHSVVITDDPLVAFKDADVALLVGAMPRKPGMQRRDLLQANVKIFRDQGAALDQVAAKNVKVVVVGNPANTNALITSLAAPSIPRENFTAMTRLDQSRATAMLAAKLNVVPQQVQGVIIWGNHSASMCVDVASASVKSLAGVNTPVDELLKNDEKWIVNVLNPAVQTRGAVVLEKRKLSSAVSAANSICQHVRLWLVGTGPGEFLCMGIPGDGSYGVSHGIVFSMPTTCSQGVYEVVRGRLLRPHVMDGLSRNIKELRDEKADAVSSLTP